MDYAAIPGGSYGGCSSVFARRRACRDLADLFAHFFQILAAGLEPLLRGLAVLLVYWLFLFWMYRRKIFLRV